MDLYKQKEVNPNDSVYDPLHDPFSCKNIHKVSPSSKINKTIDSGYYHMTKIEVKTIHEVRIRYYVSNWMSLSPPDLFFSLGGHHFLKEMILGEI